MVAGEYVIKYTRHALKDVTKIKAAKLNRKVEALIDIIRENPFASQPPYEKLRGDLQGFYSRRINRQHRLVYEVDEEARVVKILAMWTHYEGMK